MTDHAETVAKDIYVEAADFFSQLTPQPRYGHKILYAPPRSRPPILFVGFQPGGEAPELADATWPDVCHYAIEEDGPIAKKLCKMFCTDLLKQCCGVNAIFVRAPDVDAYRKLYNRQQRVELAERCHDWVVRIVEAIKPQSIVFIGFDALRLFDRHPEPRRRNAAGRVLTRTGSVADRDAIATLHLSGARISGEDFDAIKEDMLSFLQQQGVAVEMSPNGLICTVAEVASAVATHSMLEASAAN